MCEGDNCPDRINAQRQAIPAEYLQQRREPWIRALFLDRERVLLTGRGRTSFHRRLTVFAEPWQAQAFALTVRLSDTGRFSWSEWTAALAGELRQAVDRSEPDNDAARYYQHWLTALERLVTAKGLTDKAALDRRKDAWAQAYRSTPHGRPVELNT